MVATLEGAPLVPVSYTHLHDARGDRTDRRARTIDRDHDGEIGTRGRAGCVARVHEGGGGRSSRKDQCLVLTEGHRRRGRTGARVVAVAGLGRGHQTRTRTARVQNTGTRLAAGGAPVRHDVGHAPAPRTAGGPEREVNADGARHRRHHERRLRRVTDRVRCRRGVRGVETSVARVKGLEGVRTLRECRRDAVRDPGDEGHRATSRDAGAADLEVDGARRPRGHGRGQRHRCVVGR